MQEPAAPVPDIHREARLLLRAARAASLAVLESNHPSIALVTPAVRFDGAIVVLLSQLSAHTRALDRDPRCALMVSGEPTEPNPQTSPRLSLTCTAHRSDDAADRARYLAIHPYAEFYAGFTDFGIYRLQPKTARFVGGFARASALDIDRLAPATPALRDPKAAEAALAQANIDHAGSLARIAHRYGCTQTAWRAIGLDQDGLDLASDKTVIRVAFAHPLRVYADLIIEIDAMARGSRT